MCASFRHLFVLLLTVLPSIVAGQPTAPGTDGSALERSQAFAAEMEAYEEQLGDLESRYGPYHRSLLEPLQGMTALADRDQDYEFVSALQERQLQVMRTVYGFRNPELVPLMHAIIANDLLRQNWAAVADHLEHIRYLRADAPPEEKLQILAQQIDWFLQRVALDDRGERARNFMHARELVEEMVDLAEETYGEGSPELVPWHYRSALTDYRLVELLNSDRGLSSDVIDRLVHTDGIGRLQTARTGAAIDINQLLGSGNFIPVVEEGELIGEAYLRDGMRTLEKIGEIAAQQGNLEAQAMAKIYEADFQHIMGSRLAYRKYREAREQLLEAGLDEARIETYLNTPMLIPVPRLFLSLDAALADQQRQRTLGAYTGDGITLGQLVAWDDGVPNVLRPEAEDPLLAVDIAYDRVDLTLSVSTSGGISSVDVLAAEPDERSVERKASRAVRDIRVRPAIVAGKPRRTRDVHVRYLTPSEN